jgi:hypothetical protein
MTLGRHEKILEHAARLEREAEREAMRERHHGARPAGRGRADCREWICFRRIPDVSFNVEQ